MKTAPLFQATPTPQPKVDPPKQASKTTLFTIRPLEWDSYYHKYDESHVTEVLNGRYEVIRSCDEDGEWTPYSLKYCFEEYFDEGTIECDSLEDAKEKAWQDLLHRITPALITVPKTKSKQRKPKTCK